MNHKLTSVTANGRNYGIPARPLVAVCIDGIETVLSRSEAAQRFELPPAEPFGGAPLAQL
jgi:hypothetical protein